jgi:diaminohydroxyphosphoribosylaminopyrimidine deaminase / 5-amino-6-(5-phosphoribosylamino)uracil reductase
MDEIEAMKSAIKAAYEGKPFVSPNPPVGCVILDSKGRLLSSGYHKKYGGPHAEVEALKGLSNEQLSGAHVIVTLEPCAHEGKTPSCAKNLAKLPIAKVTYGLVDPNPLVAGQGAQILKKAGKEVVEFKGLKEELEELAEEFLMNHRNKKIFTALKVATSLDGQMAMKTGESQWITGEKAREYAHYLRACYDAVLVGAGTIKTDDPSLNVRHPEVQKENRVVVLDADGTMLDSFNSLKISKAHKPENIFWCTSEKSKVKNSGQIHVLKIKMRGESFDQDHLLNQLWENGIRSLLIEGGVETLGHFIREKTAHRLYLFVAPHLMGAGGAQSWTKFLSLSSMKERISLHHMRTQKMGEDLLITAKF